MSAALCVVVTVSTTVIHMNRLQTLRECLYQGSTQTCTCFAGIIDPVAMMGHHEGQYHQDNVQYNEIRNHIDSDFLLGKSKSAHTLLSGRVSETPDFIEETMKETQV